MSAPAPTLVRITSVIEGTEGFMVAFRHVSGRGVSGAITFPEREPWMERGNEVGLAMGPHSVRVWEILYGRADADDAPEGVLSGSEVVVEADP